MRRGFLYLVAIIDWATRRVLSWRLSNTLAAGFCVEALGEALARFGRPAIFNTDQGSQFTSEVVTRVLLDHRIEISMDGRGRCHDNIFVERLWWTVKYEWVCLRPASNGFEQERSLGDTTAQHADRASTPLGLAAPSCSSHPTTHPGTLPQAGGLLS
jgi:putative transposase